MATQRKKLFIVNVDSEATKDQRDAFTTFLRSKHSNGGCWHHLPFTWLIADPVGALKAVALRDRLKVMMPGVTTLVVEVAPQDWATLGSKSAQGWLEKYLTRGIWSD